MEAPEEPRPSVGVCPALFLVDGTGGNLLGWLIRQRQDEKKAAPRRIFGGIVRGAAEEG